MKLIIGLHAVLLLLSPIMTHAQQLAQAAPGQLQVRALLTNTVESGAITPVMSMVEQDVWWNGKKFIPAHSQIIGTSQPEALRDRIGCDDQFVILCRDTDADFRQLRVQGIVLDCDEANADNDGSYGMKGEITKAQRVLNGKVINQAFVRVCAGHRFILYIKKLLPDA
jgi:hypothetical protein